MAMMRNQLMLRDQPRTVQTSSHMNDSADEDHGMALYALTLLDARNFAYPIPDLETRPIILTNTAYSYNQSITAVQDGCLLILPRSNLCRVLQGRILAANSITMPGGLGSVNYAEFIPQTEVQQSRTLFQAYTYARVVSVWMGVQSATTSTTSAALSGTFNAVAFNDINDFTNFADGELADVGTTSKDIAVQVPAYHGVVYTPGPEILDKFTQPRGLTRFRYDDDCDVYTTIVNVPAIAANTLAYIAVTIPPHVISQSVHVTIDIQPNAAQAVSAGASLISYSAFYDNAGNLTFFPTGIPVCFFGFPGCSNYQFMSNRASAVLPAPFQPMVLMPYFGIQTGAIPIQAGGAMYINVILPQNTSYSATGPGALIKWSGLAVGQTLQIIGKVNLEVVPGQALVKDVKTSNWVHRTRDPTEINLAEAVFNSPNSPARRIWTGPSYESFHNDIKAVLKRDNAKYYAASLKDWLSRALRFTSTLAPVVGSMFGPVGSEIGMSVGGLAGSLSRMPYLHSAGVPMGYSAAGVPMGNAGTFHAMTWHSATISEMDDEGNECMSQEDHDRWGKRRRTNYEGTF